MESEAQALFDSLRVLTPIRGVVEDMGCPQTSPPVVFQDNQSLIQAMESPLTYTGASSAHMATRFHFIQQQLGTKAVRLAYQHTEEVMADPLTKLSVGNFSRWRSRLLNCLAPDSLAAWVSTHTAWLHQRSLGD